MKKLLLFLLALVSTASATTDSFWTPLFWPTEDAVRLVGLYHPAIDATHLTWILQHGLGSTKEEWDSFAKQVAKTGQGVLIFDARGHGASQKTTGGQPVNYQQFVREDWQKMPDDMRTTVDFLVKKYGLKRERIAIGGASLGANAALVYAAQKSEVPAVLLLSPGVEYAGINIDKAYDRYGKRPLLLAASPEDRYAFQTIQALAMRRTDANLRLIEGPGHEHGVNMLDASTTARILDWLKGLP